MDARTAELIEDVIKSVDYRGVVTERFGLFPASIMDGLALAVVVPVLLIALVFLAMAGFVIYAILLLIINAIFGGMVSDVVFYLTVVALLGYGCICVQRFRKIRYLREYLPYLNNYRAAITEYDFSSFTHDFDWLQPRLHFLATMLRGAVPEPVLREFNLSYHSSDRDVVRKLPFVASQFDGVPLKTIQEHFPPVIDLDRFLQKAWEEFSEKSVFEAGKTILGEQFELDVPLLNEYPDSIVTVSQEDRYRHAYILGRTGAGKTSALKWIINLDFVQVKHDRGVILISPEDGIFQALIPQIPEERREDFIYIDPTDLSTIGDIPHVVGFNPFDFSEADHLSPDEYNMALAQKAGEVYTILSRALGDLGVTMTTLVQNVVYTLLQIRDGSLLDIEPLLDPNDPSYRQRIINNEPNFTVDDRTRRFWENYDKGSYYTSSYAPIMNRLDTFFRPPLSEFLAKQTFSFNDAINGDRPRILFINLSKLRGEQARILGQLIIANIQQILLRREQMPEAERDQKGFNLYVDEFALFVSSEQSFIDLFERARKYRMGVMLAHQVMADLSSKLLDTLVGNVATMLIMELSARDAPYFARELQLNQANEVRRRQLEETEIARIQREEERIFKETNTAIDLLAEPYAVERLQEKIKAYAGGSLSPEIIQMLPVGHGIAKIPTHPYGIPVKVPYLEDIIDNELTSTRVYAARRMFGAPTASWERLHGKGQVSPPALLESQNGVKYPTHGKRQAPPPALLESQNGVEQPTHAVHRQAYLQLPQEARDVITGFDRPKSIYAIGERHQVHQGALQTLKAETDLVMLGLTRPHDFSQRIATLLSISPEQAIAIAHDINQEIFQPHLHLFPTLEGIDIEAALASQAEEAMHNNGASPVQESITENGRDEKEPQASDPEQGSGDFTVRFD